MEKPPRLNFNGLTALLVEGDRHSVSFLSEILRRFGLEHQHCVETGAEAKTYVQRMAVDVNKALKAIGPRLEQLALVPVFDTPAEFASSLKAERAMWGKFIQRNNITVDE